MSGSAKGAIKIINSAAPIRICDNGGWTDTWFAGHGRIFNIGVYPIVEVQLEIYPRTATAERIVINAENFGERYALGSSKGGDWDRHPLLEATIRRMNVPDDYAFEITIYSEAPSGAGTGTSAAVTVALVGALDCLTPGRLAPHEIAYTAHSVETEMLDLQSGIQDQLCSTYGGVNYIEMHEYPHATLSRIQVSNSIWWELERRLALIYLGRSHHSSQLHDQVIAGLENEGPGSPKLEPLRETAPASRDALYRGDFSSLGRAMADNTEAQRNLHPDLVSPEADRVIEIARDYGAVGWKVNGAGGDGGSLTLLCSQQSFAQRAMIREIEQESAAFANIPIYLSRHGLRIWEQ
ncbi:MAG: GHMP kinase [Candidatus Glassbacteria bacterium]|nr:GHMP kinase [Candidatus Glassbacteria bacterium]